MLSKQSNEYPKCPPCRARLCALAWIPAGVVARSSYIRSSRTCMRVKIGAETRFALSSSTTQSGPVP